MSFASCCIIVPDACIYHTVTHRICPISMTRCVCVLTLNYHFSFDNSIDLIRSIFYLHNKRFILTIQYEYFLFHFRQLALNTIVFFLLNIFLQGHYKLK